MKKILVLFLGLAALHTSVSAQEPKQLAESNAADQKYLRAMYTYVPAVDTTRNAAGQIALSGTFERIAEAEKTRWLPYYYAALTQVMSTWYMGQENMQADKTDPIADKAELLLAKAESLSPKNSEIYVVKKMIATLRMMVDPMNRYMKYGPVAAEALQIAKQLNPENPRVYLLEGQDKFYTPEQFGGSKSEAKTLFEMANKKYASCRPANELEPTWGKGTAEYFFAEASK